MHHPEDIHLERDEFRVRFLDEKIEESAVPRRFELIPVRMIREGDTLLLEGLAPFVEIGGRRALRPLR